MATLSEPFQQFSEIFEKARQTVSGDFNAMTVTTVDARGRPAARVCLLKEWDERGFVFYTNTQSRKGDELAKNPYCTLLFWWPTMEKQVRIDGKAEPVSAEEADAYFASRPRGSQIGAWASQQSRELPSREVLERRVAEFEAKYEGQKVPRPAHWSGYRVVPDQIELWTAKPSRLHDRQIFTRKGGEWSKVLYYP